MDLGPMNAIQGLLEEFNLGIKAIKEVQVKQSSKSGENSGGDDKVAHAIELLEKVQVVFQAAVNEQFAKLNDSMRKLEDKQDALEAYSRRPCLLVLGIPEPGDQETEDDCEKAVLKVFKDNLRLSVTGKDIARCHRLGPKKPNSRNRPVIVKFQVFKTRRLVFSAKSLLKGNPQKIRIAESLTRKRLDVLNAARDRYGVQQCWTSDGKILVRVVKDGESKRLVVTNMQQLDAIGASEVAVEKPKRVDQKKPAVDPKSKFGPDLRARNQK